MKYLSSEDIDQLQIGSVFYYREYSPVIEKTTWNDIVQVVGRTAYSGPIVKVIFGILNETGTEGVPSFFEITNGRASATGDKRFIIERIFRSKK